MLPLASRRVWLGSVLAAAVLPALLSLQAAEPSADPLASWRTGVKLHPVAPGQERHSIHSYFNTCPESPDGKWVLFFTSTATDGQTGEVRIRHRETGEERVLVRDLQVEDAHRAACQQWLSGGKRIAFHGMRHDRWFVGTVDLETGTEKVLAEDHLSCWGRPDADVVPLYGLHWRADTSRDLTLANAATGEVRTVVTAAQVREAAPEWWKESFGDKPASIFFPILSPDLSRVFFKMALPGNGDPRSKGASAREGLVSWSLAKPGFSMLRKKWGHPAWSPDSRHILEVGWQVIDADNDKVERLPDLPSMGSGHPSWSPDTRLIVTDFTMNLAGGKNTDWGIRVADARGKDSVLIHQFDNSHGARSWRVSHPHPVFSADGRRIYFNVNSGKWTELWVAEAGTEG